MGDYEGEAVEMRKMACGSDIAWLMPRLALGRDRPGRRARLGMIDLMIQAHPLAMSDRAKSATASEIAGLVSLLHISHGNGLPEVRKAPCDETFARLYWNSHCLSPSTALTETFRRLADYDKDSAWQTFCHMRQRACRPKLAEEHRIPS